MWFAQLLSLLGIICAFIGSIYLASHAFNRMTTLRDILGLDPNERLSEITQRHEDGQASIRKTLSDLMALFSLVFMDLDITTTDSTRRAKIGTVWLITGVLIQGAALVLTILILR